MVEKVFLSQFSFSIVGVDDPIIPVIVERTNFKFFISSIDISGQGMPAMLKSVPFGELACFPGFSSILVYGSEETCDRLCLGCGIKNNLCQKHAADKYKPCDFQLSVLLAMCRTAQDRRCMSGLRET